MQSLTEIFGIAPDVTRETEQKTPSRQDVKAKRNNPQLSESHFPRLINRRGNSNTAPTSTKRKQKRPVTAGNAEAESSDSDPDFVPAGEWLTQHRAKKKKKRKNRYMKLLGNDEGYRNASKKLRQRLQHDEALARRFLNRKFIPCIPDSLVVPQVRGVQTEVIPSAGSMRALVVSADNNAQLRTFLEKIQKKFPEKLQASYISTEPKNGNFLGCFPARCRFQGTVAGRNGENRHGTSKPDGALWSRESPRNI
ncbi:MAG: hypothetical protein SGARI_000038 [Bacillariaceae sp.]